MTEEEAGNIYAAIMDYAESIDDHVTTDDVIGGLEDLIIEIKQGVYA